jgi:hypothetical protein
MSKIPYKPGILTDCDEYKGSHDKSATICAEKFFTGVFNVVETVNNGDCFYDSLVQSGKLQFDSIDTIREYIFNQLLNDFDNIKFSILSKTNTELDDNEKMDEIQKMVQPRQWVSNKCNIDELMPQFAARYLNICLDIYNVVPQKSITDRRTKKVTIIQSRIDHYTFGDSGLPIVYLLRTGDNHYKLLTLVKGSPRGSPKGLSLTRKSSKGSPKGSPKRSSLTRKSSKGFNEYNIVESAAEIERQKQINRNHMIALQSAKNNIANEERRKKEKNKQVKENHMAALRIANNSYTRKNACKHRCKNKQMCGHACCKR